jgi:proteasome lid subunit RPN8/RPN11
MNYSIVRTIRRLYAPQHELSCSWLVWRRLVKGLRERGQHGKHESGAFLLGRRYGGCARITSFVLYDDLDPRCLESGIVRFDGRYFGALWELCNQRDVSVVADIHTHPMGPQQSHSDRAHPMISRSGHIALIVPRFAAQPVKLNTVGMYRYEGSKRWTRIPDKQRKTFFHIGI